jgi:hypothetical protein
MTLPASFSSTTSRRKQFSAGQPSSRSNSPHHIGIWPTPALSLALA